MKSLALHTEQLAKAALELGAIQLKPEAPFTWTSGFKMPVYNDNRLLLSQFTLRSLVGESFAMIIQEQDISVDIVAGTATAGIPPATTLADKMKLPLAYVRSQPKGHGTKSQVEGVLEKGKNVLLVEDLVSTGKSSLGAVKALRSSEVLVKHCVAVFSYGFAKAQEAFCDENCMLHTLLTFDTLLEIATQNDYISSSERTLLEEWSQEPFLWGEKHGFLKEVAD